jgi:hypothetical protein
MFIQTGSLGLLLGDATIFAIRNVGMFKEVQHRTATLKPNTGIWHKYYLDIIHRF